MPFDPKYTQQIDTLKEQKKQQEKDLREMPTGVGSGSPSNSAVKAYTQYEETEQALRDVGNKATKEYWYGVQQKEQEREEGNSGGILMKTLDALNTPLYGVVGATKHALGESDYKSLYDSIQKNITDDKDLFGDVLAKSGAPQAVSAPLGLTLDIMFDPVNWATVGTAALVPRVAKGAIKGGVRGALEGARSSLGRKALTVGRLTGASKTNAYKSLSESILKSSNTYDEIIGRNIDDLVSNNSIGSEYRKRIGEYTKAAIETVPGGESFLKHLSYDNAEWMRLSRVKDAVTRAMGADEQFKGAVKAYFEGKDFVPFVSNPKAKNVVERFPAKGGLSQETDELLEKFLQTDEAKVLSQTTAGGYTEDLANAVDIINNPDYARTSDAAENLRRLVDEDVLMKGQERVTMEELKKIVDSGVMGETGVKWFDSLERKVKDFKIQSRNSDKVYNVGEKLISAYKAHIDTLKLAKVAGSPAAWTNAVLGNITMAHMAGINVTDRLYIQAVKDAKGVLSGRNNSSHILGQLLATSDFSDFIKLNPSAFSRTYGMSSDFLESKYFVESVLQRAKDMGVATADMGFDDVARLIDDAAAELKSVSPSQSARELAKESLQAAKKGVRAPSPLEYAKQKMIDGSIPVDELPTSFFGAELSSSELTKLTDFISKKSVEEGANPIYKVLKPMVNKPIEALEKTAGAYERIDQTNKFALMLYASRDGLTEAELNIVKKFIKLEGSDIIGKTAVDGQMRYKLSGFKSTELANETFLNYSAMPGAVKVLRNMPILGQPFASFMYGMYIKTGKTLVNNPAAFNKVTQTIDEMSGQKSPLERRAIEGDYYSYLDDPAMFRLPLFFEENPMYINLANMIPYYTLNMFTPSQRKYNDTIPDALIELVDRTPFLKDPYGQVLFDYVILPSIIKDSMPESYFGQPVYPAQSSRLERFGFAARTLADSTVPGVAALTGPLMPEWTHEYLPSYRWRQFARASVGKNAYGISTNESAGSRSLRTALGISGVPVQSPINLSFTRSENKD